MFESNRKVCIVGAGPAGLAAAIAFAGFASRVTVVDCAALPVDKPCGEGLLPDCAEALKALGIPLPADVGFPFRGIRFENAHSQVSADFPNGFARGVRRPLLHRLLAEHAARLGVTLAWNAKHAQLVPGGVALGNRFIEADLVIAADGQNSAIRRQANLHHALQESHRYGFRRHYAIAPWSPYMEFYWGAAAQIYLTPVAANEICVAVLSSDPQLRLDRALPHFPQLYNRLKHAPHASSERGGVSVSRHLRRVMHPATPAHPLVVLIGDASGSVDAITGEGICLSFKQSLALAEAARDGDLRAYCRAHQRLMRRPRAMASLMLFLARNPRLEHRALAGLARHPDVFESLLGIHVGASSFLDLCSWRLMHFGRALLTA